MFVGQVQRGPPRPGPHATASFGMTAAHRFSSLNPSPVSIVALT
jgi:hypothetical protein